MSSKGLACGYGRPTRSAWSIRRDRHAHGVGAGLRLDVSWISFVERTTLRLDVAKSVNADTGVQVWFGVNQPF